MIPFTMDVEENAHQIPVSPIRPPKRTANGIRALVKLMLIMLQRRVRPSPDKAPTVISSSHIKPSQKPMIIR